MLETNLSQNIIPTGNMKCPSSNIECIEFNLGRAPILRCSDQKITTCGECESCLLAKKIPTTKEWFEKIGDESKRRFVLGLIRNLHSIDLMKNIVNLLQPSFGKDFTYARSRTKPSLKTDNATMSGDRAMSVVDVEQRIAETLFWFQNASYWTKSNFLMAILKLCEAHLLHTVGKQANTSLPSEQNALLFNDDCYETSSIASSVYTYHTDDHPELDLLTMASMGYSHVETNPLSEYVDVESECSPTITDSHCTIAPVISLDENENQRAQDDRKEEQKLGENRAIQRRKSSTVEERSSIIQSAQASSKQQSITIQSDQKQRQVSIGARSDESQRKSFTGQSERQSIIANSEHRHSTLGQTADSGQSLSSASEFVDPTCLVVPSSAKAHSGVSAHKDFIRCLPVSLSKYILSFLDRVSLYNCVCVSKAWRPLAEEVHNEAYINQELQEYVMLMQGASSEGANPVYANDIDVAVPNLHPHSSEVIKTNENEIQTVFKTEVSFRTAYSGVSTRNIIMEERNVYCGAYNVMVIVDATDSTRMIHTNGHKLIAMGGINKRIHLIDAETGQVCDVSMTGHAGSIKCVELCETRGFVLSGSYDTSIRKWSLETGKCMKIFRGHQDTVTCLQVCGDLLASGAKDNTCKVWDIGTGKSRCTFKHKAPVWAVALSDEVCVSGDEGGKVKVWHLQTQRLIKRLSGHHGCITGIRFDRWHIVTTSSDCYALCWSAQGNHTRCLTALRHPDHVTAVAFMYLRVITGAHDGKVRIWNMINGNCLRIMRGNSRSDPILQLTAIGNRITINTCSNVLVLNFEPVEYDYTLLNDKTPPRVQYAKYSDAPIRQQAYPYIRANRQDKAGTANPAIIHHGPAKAAELAHCDTMSYSAKSLSRKSMRHAKRIHSAKSHKSDRVRREVFASPSIDSFRTAPLGTVRSANSETTSAKSRQQQNHMHHSPPSSSGYPGAPTTTSEPPRGQAESGDLLSDEQHSVAVDSRRRVSWAFEHPIVSSPPPLTLPDTKSLFRSQIRATGKPVPPDFIYLTVNAIQKSMEPKDPAAQNMEKNRNIQNVIHRQPNRPASSPSKIDPRTKIPVDDESWEQFLQDHVLKDSQSDSYEDTVTASPQQPPPATKPQLRSTILTEFANVPIQKKSHQTLYRSSVKSTIPPPSLVQPCAAVIVDGPLDSMATASKALGNQRLTSGSSSKKRAKSGSSRRADTAVTLRSGRSAGGASRGVQSAPEMVDPKHMVPMLMYGKDVRDRIAEMKQRNQERQQQLQMKPQRPPPPPSGPKPPRRPGEPAPVIEPIVQGRVSEHNHPLRTNAEFRLRTHHEITEQMANMENTFQRANQQNKEREERRRQQAWKKMVRGLMADHKSGQGDTTADSRTRRPKTAVM